MADYSIASNSGSYTIVGAASSLAFTLPVAGSSYAVTGTAVTFKHGFGVAAVSGVYALTGTLVQIERITGEPGAYLVSGKDVNLRHGPLKVIAVSGSYGITGTTTLRLQHSVGTDRGTLFITGTAATLIRSGSGNTLGANSGSYSLTGGTASLIFFRLIDSGFYTITGVAATLKVGDTIVANSGHYTLNGQAANLKRGFKFTASPTTYSLQNPAPIGLVYSNSAAKFILVEGGVFAITGQPATLRLNRNVSAAVGSYALTGQDIGLGNALVALSELYSIVGQAASLLHGSQANAIAGSYILTGGAAALQIPILFTVDSGTYTYAPLSSGLSQGRFISANAGVYLTGGTDANLKIPRIIADSAQYHIAGSATTALESTRPRRWRKQKDRPRSAKVQTAYRDEWADQPESPGV